MNHKIRPQDIKVGDYIFISEWLDADKKETDIWGNEFNHKKPIGDPFKVLGVAFPFIAVELCALGKNGTLDTRLSEFIKVDKKYVQSLLPNYGNKKRNDHNDIDLSKVKQRYNQTTKKWEHIIGG